MKNASFFFAAVFLLAAAVQWNDPDPLLWILAYVTGAGLSLAAGLGQRLFLPKLIAASLFGLWFLSLGSTLFGAPQEAFTSFKMQATAHEEPREAVGMGLMALWTFVLAYQARRRPASEASSVPSGLPGIDVSKDE